MFANKTDTNRPRVQELWPLVLLAVFYGFCISQAILSVTLVQMPAVKVFFIQTALTVIISVIFYRPLFAGLAAGIIALTLLCWFGLTYFKDSINMFGSLSEFVNEISGSAVYSAKFDFTICFIVCVFSGILSVVFIVKISSFSAAAAMGCFVFGMKWTLGYDYAPYCFYIFLAVICALGLRRLNITMMRRAGETTSRPSGLYMLITLPLCVALTAASFFAAPIKTTNAELFDLLTSGNITTLSDFFNVLTSESYDSVADSGFGTGSVLGGDVTQDYTPVMEVSSKRSGTVYLSGMHSNQYNGLRWQNTLNTYENMPSTVSPSAEELNFLLTDTTGPFSKNTVHIYPLKTTRTMFVPSGLVDINDKKAHISASGDIRSFTAYRKGEDYLTTSMVFNDFPINRVSPLEMIPDYVRLANGHRTFFYDFSPSFDRYYRRARGVIFNQSFLTPNDNATLEIYKKLIEYADFVYANYLDLPENLPARVPELANSVAVSGNKFTKVDQIRRFLSNYDYTLTPGDVPSGHDFTDYFLFDSKRGYCTYFASAMCVMARAVGVPARYVEGYVAKGAVSDIKQTVTNADAHAWAECYFEGVGWIILEATPPYYQTSSAANPAGDSSANTDASSGASSSGMGSTPSGTSSAPSGSSSAASSSAASGASSSAPAKGSGGSLWIFIICGLAAFSAAAILTVVLNNRRLRRKRRIAELKTAPASEAIAICFDFICRLAEADGNPRETYETALQYGHRLSGIYTYGDCDMLTIAEIYSVTVYSDNGLAPEEELQARETAAEFFDAMYADMLERKGHELRRFHRYLSDGGFHE